MKPRSSLSRRQFLKNASLASGLLIIPASVLGRDGTTAPSNRINIAAVGVGGQGGSDISNISNAGGTLIGLCDVDSNRLGAAQKKFPSAKTFADYREMFDKLGKDIDAVSVSTPDHTHFTVTMTAAIMGKHVYVQKPLCHTVDQARRLAQVAAEKNIVSQMGNQGHSNPHIRLAKEWYEAGLFGEISEVQAWSSRPIWPQGMADFRPATKVPDSLNWDLWLGPAKARPYSPKIAPFDWRGYYEFGCGALGDMAAHIMDPAYYILDLGAPTKIDVQVSGKSKVAYPSSSTITYHFSANGKRGPVKLVWRDGKLKPEVPAGVSKLPGDASLFLGKNTAFMMGCYGESLQTFPGEDFKKFQEKAVPVKYPRTRGGHFRNWIDAIRKGEKSCSDFSYACPFTEVILLGVIAQRLGRTLNWDGQAGKFSGDDEANTLLVAPPSRQGFLA